jgi:hypothetical protein
MDFGRYFETFIYMQILSYKENPPFFVTFEILKKDPREFPIPSRILLILKFMPK